MMNVSTFTFIVTVATICIFGTLATSVQKGDMDTLTMVYLGTVQGKSYFAEDTSSRNWTEALKACNNSGMKMAKITTSLQATFLQNAKLNSSYYWLGSRDTFTLQRIVWDDDLTTPNASILPVSHNLGMYGCLNYIRTNQLQLNLCSIKSSTLCEINPG